MTKKTTTTKKKKKKKKKIDEDEDEDDEDYHTILSPSRCRYSLILFLLRSSEMMMEMVR